jgi:hypothetical protein
MEERFGQMTGELAEQPADSVMAELVRLINQKVNPPQLVAAEEVSIRSMYILSDQVNSYGGRFPDDEHERLCALLVDSPVMVGHRKDALPIGRNFHAVQVDRDGHPWVRSYFYWLNSADGADSLRENIDKGVYKECSIGFTYVLPECSICGEDIRHCRHSLFQAYRDNGTDEVCHFNYRQIQKVLETSLVYRGATPNTAVSTDLQGAAPSSHNLPIIARLDQLGEGKRYLVVPHYEGLSVTISGEPGQNEWKTLDGEPLDPVIRAIDQLFTLPPEGVIGKLVGYRGKERCSIEHLRTFLATGRKPVSRVTLYLYPDEQLCVTRATASDSCVRLFPHRFASQSDLLEVVTEMATKSGVEIWELADDGSLVAGARYLPSAEPKAGRPSFGLFCQSDSHSGLLAIERTGVRDCFLIHNLNITSLMHGGRFVADRVAPNHPRPSRRIFDGTEITLMESGGLRLNLATSDKRELRLQPIRLHGRSRYLAYMAERKA